MLPAYRKAIILLDAVWWDWYSRRVNYESKHKGGKQNGAPFGPTQGRRGVPVQGTGNRETSGEEGVAKTSVSAKRTHFILSRKHTVSRYGGNE